MRQLNHGEVITQTDEALIGGAWQRVPAEWVGESVDYQTELEPDHSYVPVRRETSDAVELPKTIHQQPQAEICPVCHGTKQVEGPVDTLLECDFCGGTGKLHHVSDVI